MEFPCDFTIKVIGENSASCIDEITEIARKHFPNLSDEAIRKKPSKQGKYLAFSITVHAQDQATLDAFYLELTKHPDIKMVL